MCPDGNAEFLQKRAIASPFRHTQNCHRKQINEIANSRHSDQTESDQLKIYLTLRVRRLICLRCVYVFSILHKTIASFLYCRDLNIECSNSLV